MGLWICYVCNSRTWCQMHESVLKSRGQGDLGTELPMGVSSRLVDLRLKGNAPVSEVGANHISCPGTLLTGQSLTGSGSLDSNSVQLDPIVPPIPHEGY